MFYHSRDIPGQKLHHFKIQTENSNVGQSYRESFPKYGSMRNNNTPLPTAIPVLSILQQETYPIAAAIDQYISKLANMAKIDTKVERLAIDIAHKTNNHLLADGKSPNGLAAAYIYLASVLLGVSLLQMEISNFAGITEVTIRNRCKDILSSFKITVIVKPLHKE
jgi:transcription initiation factor TFIIIB Brf1 subunit/transcription initiation factor TFIIB